MRLRYALSVAGIILFCVGFSMLFALCFAIYYGDAGFSPLAWSLLITLVCGGILIIFFKKHTAESMNHREGMVIVVMGWLAAALAGALPFWFSGLFGGFGNSFFESMSGFTTTGASILTHIEAIPKSLLFWRSFTHWLGGMGIIVLSLAILPFLGLGGMQLYKAEVPGPVPDKLKPRIKDTAVLLWKVYLVFTVLQVVLLLLGGMDLFDSLCHTFGTMATGGFSTKNTSIASYSSVYFDVVFIIFMLIAGVNFALNYYLLRGKPLFMLKDQEFRFFILLFILATALCTVSVWGVNYASLGQALRYSAFQVASIFTTTGYATADYELWPPLARITLILLMFVGGCAGSTSGGIKCMRIFLLIRLAYQELFRLIHPRAITSIKLSKKNVPPEVLSSIVGFFMLFLGLFMLCAFLLAAMGLDLATSFSAVLATMGNIGPGFGAVGPAENYAHIPLSGKWILVFCMLLGRLEIYTLIILLVPEFWRK